MTDVHGQELELGADLEAPRAARRFVARVLTDWRVDGDLVDRAQLLVSELVSNAVQYGEGPVQVMVRPVAASERAIRSGSSRAAVARRSATLLPIRGVSHRRLSREQRIDHNN